MALRAVPDSYSFQLDSNFNLARQTLRVMDNDTGIGISIASYKTGNFFGKLDLDKTNNLFYYEVSNYGGSAFTWYFNYTIRDVNFANSATTVTVNVGEWCLAALAAVVLLRCLVLVLSRRQLHCTRLAMGRLIRCTVATRCCVCAWWG